MFRKLANETSFKIAFKQKTKRYWSKIPRYLRGYWLLDYWILKVTILILSSIKHRFASPTAYVSYWLVGLRGSFTII